MKNIIIELNNVNKSFAKNQSIVKDVSLQIEKGNIIGIIGRNGSGKTVLLKMIAGFYHPTSGSITIEGKELSKSGEFPKNVGVLIDTGFINEISGIKNLLLLADLNKKASKKDCYDTMERVGLDPFSKKKYGKYSSGMKQRLKLAQAIMEHPNILILDEPFNGIDEDGVIDFRTYIKDLKKEGKTIIITSHNKEDIAVLCDKTYEMSKGNLKEIN